MEAPWQLVKRMKKDTFKLSSLILRWIEWAIQSSDLKQVSSYSKISHYYLVTDLEAQIRKYIDDLAIKWNLDFDSDFKLILRKLWPVNESEPIEIAHDEFALLLRKRMQSHLDCVSKKIPKLVASLIASFLPMEFPQKDRWELYDYRHGYQLVERPITFGFDPAYGNYTNDMYMQAEHHQHHQEIYDDFDAQLLEMQDWALQRKKC